MVGGNNPFLRPNSVQLRLQNPAGGKEEHLPLGRTRREPQRWSSRGATQLGPEQHCCSGASLFSQHRVQSELWFLLAMVSQTRDCSNRDHAGAYLGCSFNREPNSLLTEVHKEGKDPAREITAQSLIRHQRYLSPLTCSSLGWPVPCWSSLAKNPFSAGLKQVWCFPLQPEGGCQKQWVTTLG